MMNWEIARTQGLAIPCHERLTQPVTSPGEYRCTADHLHIVSWRDGRPSVSALGYDPAFRVALNNATEAATLADREGTPRYAATFQRVMREYGYGAVLHST